MAAFSRLVTHGKIRHTGDSLMEMVPKYPYGLNAEEQGTVESLMRAMWGSLFGIELQRDPSALKWAREFWQQSRRLSPCVFDVFKSEIPVSDGATDGHLIRSRYFTLAVSRPGQHRTTVGNTLRMPQTLGAFCSPETVPRACAGWRHMYRTVHRSLGPPIVVVTSAASLLASAWPKHESSPRGSPRGMTLR